MGSYLFVDSPEKTFFQFDLVSKEERNDETEWTQYAIEDGSQVSDYGSTKPTEYNIEGFVTATPMLSEYNRKRIDRVAFTLRGVQLRREVITAVMANWSPKVVIDSIGQVETPEDGEGVRLHLKMHTVQLPKTQRTDIPASRFKRKVRRKAAKPAKGGVQQGRPASKEAQKKLQSRLKAAKQYAKHMRGKT